MKRRNKIFNLLLSLLVTILAWTLVRTVVDITFIKYLGIELLILVSSQLTMYLKEHLGTIDVIDIEENSTDE